MKHRTFARLNRGSASLSILIALAACSKQAPTVTPEISDQNLRTNAAPANDYVGDYRVMRNDVLLAKEDGITLLSAESGDASKFLKTSPKVDPRTLYAGTFPNEGVTVFATNSATDTLMVGLPIGSLGEERILGGVITGVSATKNENLGSLKLSDFPMIHGKLMLAGLDTKSPQLVLVGCTENCTEASARVPVIGFPIAAVDAEHGLLMLDLSAVGRDLNLIAMEDPLGTGTGLTSKSSTATKFDFSAQTIIFDIDSKTVAADPVNNPLPDTTFTVRWYLKSSAAFDSAFTPRPATPGVGFFMTDTSATPKIKRWSLARYGDAGVKYYLKHIPAEWQAAFASSFDEWNDKFQANFGRKIFDYEFIPENDPRNDLLVTGDIRYNIVEWDLVNAATYGGLGPSEGNEFTGEIISSNVLIQGPTVMKLYSDWFKLGDKVAALAAQGKSEEAASALRDYSRASDESMKEPTQNRLTVAGHSFTIHAERPELADPYAQRNDFDELPPNVDFKTYVYGYFHDMLTHELGHNLGLRHNFRGNMGATDTGAKGSTSRSVMEYLGRRYRYLDGVGAYDVMALNYGYKAIAPDHLDWFCTDEDAYAPKSKTASAECSADDATSDPYNFFEFRLSRAIDYLTARGQSYAPVWTIADLTRELGIAQKGLLSYAAAAKADQWSNFFGKGSRPAADAASVSSYVVARVKQQLCDPNLDLVVSGKYDPAAQDLTRKQIAALRENTLKYFSSNGIDLGFDINCAPVTAAPTLVKNP